MTSIRTLKDVKRVRDALREIGFAGELVYKTDVATKEALYKKRGARQISRYRE
jgi:hypothetical protein